MRRMPPVKRPSIAYSQLWRVVDGAVRDTFKQHPDYLPSRRREKDIRASINKRVTGAVLGYATEVAKGRSGEGPAAENDPALAKSGGVVARVGIIARLWAGLTTRPNQFSGGRA